MADSLIAGSFLGCKFLIAMIFITAGIICGFANNSCSEDAGSGLIGFGLGIFAGSILSLLVILSLGILETLTNITFLKARIFLLIKFISALILLIIGSACLSKECSLGKPISSGILGSSFGLFFSTIVSSALFLIIWYRHGITKC